MMRSDEKSTMSSVEGSMVMLSYSPAPAYPARSSPLLSERKMSDSGTNMPLDLDGNVLISGLERSFLGAMKLRAEPGTMPDTRDSPRPLTSSQ
jgi:hypothetical protein